MPYRLIHLSVPEKMGETVTDLIDKAGSHRLVAQQGRIRQRQYRCFQYRSGDATHAGIPRQCCR